jgi:catechol 2,3-dioxygenase-like lactoylglutathione lyase family enzyme
MNPYVSAIILGVRDIAAARQFYAEGLGWPVYQDYGGWVSFKLGDGTTCLGLYPRENLAGEAGIDAGGNGFQGIALSYVVREESRVGEILAEAEKAGGRIVKPVEKPRWGGSFGYFADRDGNLWKVASGPGDQPFAAE